MQNPNPIIPLQATFQGCQVLIRGLRKLPVEEVEGLLAELVGQINAFIKKVEDEEKAAAETSSKAVDAVAKELSKGRPKGSKNKPKPAAAEPVDGGVPVL